MKKIIIILIIFLLCGSIYYIGTNFYIPCIFKKITGFYCPGCGITRMFRSLLELNIYQAFRYNPLVFILLILGLIYLIYYLYIKISKKELKKISKKIWYYYLLS